MLDIDGNQFGGEDIISMRLIRRAEDLPVKGIVSSELVVRLRTDMAFSPNAKVTVKVGGVFDMSFADHYISKISRSGDVLEFHAFDLMRRLENDFDDSKYNEEDEPFNSLLFIADLANQLGFEGVENIPSVSNDFYFKEIHRKKAREILNEISRYACGVWYCTNSNKLKFTTFMSSSCGINAEIGGSSRLYLHSVKGPFKAAYGENTVNGQIFSAGGASADFRNILRVAADRMSQERLSAIMSAVAEKEYQAFYCKHIELMDECEGLTEFSFDQRPSGLISTYTVIHFTGSGVYAEARAADICEDESDYIDATGYEFRRRIERYREYGSTVMTNNGIAFLEDDDEGENKAEYGFSAVCDGVLNFKGAIMDNVMPDRIENISDSSKRIVYGGSAYILSFTKGENGEKTNISLKREDG